MGAKNSIVDLFDKTVSGSGEYNSPSMYINRELSWLSFNERVLSMAVVPEVPLLEKAKFLGIAASNMDEFIMVRLSSIRNKINQSMAEGIEIRDISGLTPEEEYREVFHGIMEAKDLHVAAYGNIMTKFKNYGIRFYKFKDLSRKEKDDVTKTFYKQIYPLLTPIAYDTTKEFPLIKSKQFNILVSVEDKNNPNLNVVSIIPIDNGLNRIYEIKSDDQDIKKFIMLEDIIFAFLGKIFINKNIIDQGCFKILREADIELEHSVGVYIVDRMKQNLKERAFSSPIFMEITEGVPKNIVKMLSKTFDLPKGHVFKSDGIVDLTFLMNMPIKNPDISFDEFKSIYPHELIGGHDMFTLIEADDLLLHHPFDSYDPVVKFIEHAADDRDVVAIKQTLYRVSSVDSPIVEALCRAAENGKQVSVLLEIKARFDEERNLSLIEKLKLSGCKLIYGVEHLKTHCKFVLVVKKTNKGLKMYSHIGTGNYNDKTAKIYTDFSYFTCNSKICEDMVTIFNILSGFSDPTSEIKSLIVSPHNIRNHLYKMIDKEIKQVKKGNIGSLTFKLNSLSDKGIISKLYEASEAGVKVNIICRGICSMKPINKNIKIKSIIGRFLEHSRVYIFNNNGDKRVFISSADMLTRNLDSRVELMVPIENSDIKEKILSIVDDYMDERIFSFKMCKSGRYELFDLGNIDVHNKLIYRAVTESKLQTAPRL